MKMFPYCVKEWRWREEAEDLDTRLQDGNLKENIEENIEENYISGTGTTRDLPSSEVLEDI